MEEMTVIVEAPARLCLLGEHQDYFGLSVLSGAMDLTVRITGRENDSNRFSFALADIGGTDSFPVDGEFPYMKPRDYLRSCVRVMRRRGIQIDRGWDVSIKGTIPIGKGNSSSSALVIGWLRFLFEAFAPDLNPSPEVLAELGYEAEVLEFGEPGGKQDHYAIAMGGLIHLTCGIPAVARRLQHLPDGLLLVDSGYTKDTQGVLSHIKLNVLAALDSIGRPDLGRLSPAEVRKATDAGMLGGVQARMLAAVVRNRDITRRGMELFEASELDRSVLGNLLNEHHRELRDGLDVSTPEIEALLSLALESGALGGKINGSGGGGCCLIYAPGCTAVVTAALEAAGAAVYGINLRAGVAVVRSRRRSAVWLDGEV